MTETNSNHFQGKVIGWMVKFIPLRKGGEDAGTHTRLARIAAFLTIQVNGKKIHNVPCRSAELVYDAHRLREFGVKYANELTEELVDDHKERVMQTLIDQHPLNRQQPFKERVTTRINQKALRIYSLSDE